MNNDDALYMIEQQLISTGYQAGSPPPEMRIVYAWLTAQPAQSTSPPPPKP